MDRSFRLAYFSPRVREEIESWPVDLLARCVAEGFCKAVELLDLLEDHGPLLGSPHSKALGEGLFELRPRSSSGIGRAFFCYCSGRMIIVLHAFIKKTQKTPQRDLTIARMPDVNYVGGSRQLRRRVTPGPPPAMAGGVDSEK